MARAGRAHRAGGDPDPVELATGDGFGAVASGVELGGTTPGRLGLGCRLGVGLGFPITANAPPSATTATIAAATNVVLDMGRVFRIDHQARR